MLTPEKREELSTLAADVVDVARATFGFPGTLNELDMGLTAATCAMVAHDFGFSGWLTSERWERALDGGGGAPLELSLPSARTHDCSAMEVLSPVDSVRGRTDD